MPKKIIIFVSMKMKIFEELRIKFEYANRSHNPELGLLDTILEAHQVYQKYISGINDLELQAKVRDVSLQLEG